jgi:hypothetical protein
LSRLSGEREREREREKEREKRPVTIWVYKPEAAYTV